MFLGAMETDEEATFWQLCMVTRLQNRKKQLIEAYTVGMLTSPGHPQILENQRQSFPVMFPWEDSVTKSISQDQLLPDQLSWDQLATRSTLMRSIYHNINSILYVVKKADMKYMFLT